MAYKPLKVGARTDKEKEKAKAIWYAGAWRSPQGVENYRIRMRLRQRERRANGTGR